jgi:uncharacterized protein YkwD
MKEKCVVKNLKEIKMKYILCLLFVLFAVTVTKAETETEARMIKAVNAYRAKWKLPPLVMDKTLMKVASQRCPFGSHCIHGKWMWDAVRPYGYWATDDIAMGYTDPVDCVRGWISSDGHARQMRGQFKLNGRWIDRKPDRIGVARSGNRWIAVFGLRLNRNHVGRKVK